MDEDGIIVELDVSKKQEKKTAAPIERLVEEQVLKAVRGASVVLFMVDGKAGLSVTDERLAPVVRKIGNEPGPPSVLLVANKMDYDRTGERSGTWPSSTPWESAIPSVCLPSMGQGR